jgi:Uma2 family endonuclease
MTADQLLTLPGEGRRELVEGVLCEMGPAGGDHGIVAAEIGGLLREYRQQHGGRSFAAETGFLLARNPDTVRAPDAAYVGRERTRAVERSPGFWPGPPDLAAEVVSPGDTHTDVHEKALAWVSAGCKVVLVVDPIARHVTRYRATDDVATFSDEQTVDCATAMPGFTPTVATLLGDG